MQNSRYLEENFEKTIAALAHEVIKDQTCFFVVLFIFIPKFTCKLICDPCIKLWRKCMHASEH